MFQFDDQLIENYLLGRTSLCAEDFEIMRNWYPNIARENANELTESGFNAMVSIAQHYQAAFPTLLPQTYSRSTYLFRHSGIQRTQRSAEGFCEGLFGVNGHLFVEFEEIPENDTFLRVS